MFSDEFNDYASRAKAVLLIMCAYVCGMSVCAHMCGKECKGQRQREGEEGETVNTDCFASILIFLLRHIPVSTSQGSVFLVLAVTLKTAS